MKKIKLFAEKLFCAVYPKRCALCDSILESSELFICRKCASEMSFIKGRTCALCGTVLKSRFDELCAECLNAKRAFDEGFAPFAYDGSVRSSIARFKYHSRAEYAPFYAACICRYGGERIKSWNPESIIPVPAHPLRAAMRGYDQAFLLAKELGKLTGISVESSLIKRTKKTKAQKDLSAAERKMNLASAFSYVSDKPAPEIALIADDIFTTGSTVNAVSRILRSHGAKHIYIVCIATS